MSLVIPTNIKPYTQPLSVFPARTFVQPAEGRYVIPIELDWDGSGAAFDVNIAGKTTQPFSKIVMLDVDNTECGADVTFFFPDTMDTLQVPAGTAGLFPVFTNGLLFYAAATASLASDVTRLRVLNFWTTPLSNPLPQYHSYAGQTGVNPVTGTAGIIAASASGTLVAYDCFISLIAGAGLGNLLVQLVDHHTGGAIDQAYIELPANGVFNGIGFSLGGSVIRYAAGIDLSLTAGGVAFAGGGVSVSVKYRNP